MKKTILYIILMVITSMVFGQNVYVVTKTTDPNPFTDPFNNDDALCDPDMYGTLQWAINKVNYNSGESRIVFNIPGNEPHDIVLNSYLPQITNSVTIDATSQAGYLPGSYMINLNGQGMTMSCFSAHNCKVIIKGFHIFNFKNFAIQLNLSDDSEILENRITSNSNSGTYSSAIIFSGCNNIKILGNIIEDETKDLTALNYSHGLYLKNSINCIIGGTESGQANTITNCKTGVYLGGCTSFKISRNAIYNNLVAISLILSNNDILPPVITNYSNSMLSGTAFPNSTIEVFGSTGSENANVYLTSVIADGGGDWSVEVNTEYEYFVATATDVNNNTSAYSAAMPLIPIICNAPTNVAATLGISTTHTLTWAEDTFAFSYQVAVGLHGYSNDSAAWLFSYNEISNNSITVTGLDINTVYEYYVRTNCGTGVSEWIGPVVFNEDASQNGLSCNSAIELDLTEQFHEASFQMHDSIIWISFTATSENIQLLLNTSPFSNPARIRNLSIYEGECDNLSLLTNIDVSHRILGNFIIGNAYTIKIESDNIGDFNLALWTDDVYPATWYGRLYFKIENNSFIELPDYFGGSYCCSNDMTELIEKYNISRIYKPFDKLYSIELQKTYQIDFYDTDSVYALFNDLQNLGYVEYSEKIPIDRIMVTQPSDYSAGTQWNLDIINAVGAWGELNSAQIQNEVIIAVVDNEIRTTHEDLAGNLWVNNEIAGNNIDDDNNGYIDDINGFDVADNDPNTSPPNTNFNHGTHVSGIAAGTTNNSTMGIASISWGADIMAIKTANDASNPAALDNAWGGVQYAIANNADVVNMSWGSPGEPSQVSQNIINYGHSLGIIFVAAAGNDNHDFAIDPRYPALYDNVITVGSTGTVITGNDIKSGFSNFGVEIDVMAPGNRIYSTYSHSNTTYGLLDGTSMACPLVSGLCALMLKYDPNLTPGAVQNCISTTCDDIYNLNDPIYSGKLGAGRVNAYEAIKCLQTPPIADFNSDYQLVCTNQDVHLFDNSTGAPMTTWHWTFTPNTVMCANPNDQNPEVQFLIEGEYTVTLEVTNSLGTDAITKENYIIVNECTPIFSEQGNWYFGNNAGVSFTGGIATSIQPSEIVSGEGCASISDSQGNLLFYTDGRFAWNTNHTAMGGIMNGCGNNQCSASQAVTIVPDPGNPMQYYIFCVPNLEILPVNFGLEFSIVNMGLNNNLGDFVVINQSVPNNFNVTEHLSVIPHCNGVDYWIIVHPAEQSNSDQLLAYRLTANGIIDPPVSSQSFSVTIPHLGNDWIGQIDVAPNGKIVAITNLVDDRVYIYSFDQQLGTFNLLTTLDGHTNIYGTSFSPNSEVLYFTEGSNLIQYNIADITNPVMYTLNNVFTVNYLSTPQLGPDGRIYISEKNRSFLAVINDPNNLNVGNVNFCHFIYDAIPLIQIPGNWPPVSQIGLPNMIDAIVPNPNNPNFNYSVSNCNNVTFQPFPCGIIYNWDFGDGYMISGNGDNTIPIGTNNGTTSGSFRYPTHEYSENGYYEVTLTIGGNSNTETVIVGVNVVASATNTNCLSCTGTAVAGIVGGSPPFTFEWNDSFINPQITQTATDLCEGIYSVTVTDINNCTGEATAIVDRSIADVQVSSTNALCYGTCEGTAYIESIGGTPPYVILWSNGFTGYLNENLCAGDYDVTITDNTLCAATATVTIDEPEPLIANISSSTNVCLGSCNGSAFVNASGGTPNYSFLWNDPGSQATEQITGLCAGPYTVTATDINGCTATDDVTITVNSPVITMSTDLLTCYGQGITIGGSNIVSNGTPPFTYYWSNGVNTPSQTVTPLVTTSYVLTVTDANFCTAIGTVFVTVNPQLTVTADANSFPNCPGEQTILTAYPLGGSPGYTYQWSNSLGTNQTAEVFPLVNSTYSVVVSDFYGCTAETSVNTEIAYSINSIISENSCPNDNNGFITIIINTNTLNSFPNSVHWNSDFTSVFTQTSSNTYETTVSGLAPGTYNYDVTDALGCHINGSVDIEVYSIPHYDPVVSISCPNANTGSIVPNISNASEPYEYLWSNSETTENIYNLPSGNYVLTFIYGNDCVDISSYIVDEEPVITLSVSNTSADYNETEIGSALISFIYADYAAGSYSVSLTNHVDYSNSLPGYNIENNLQASSLPNGLYDVTLNSPNSCAYTVQFSIDEVMEYVSNSCPEVPTGSINLVFYTYGVTNPLTTDVYWSNDQLTTVIFDGYYEELEQYKYHTDITGLAPGTYTYYITDAWGNVMTHDVIVGVFTEPGITYVSTPSCISPSNGALNITVSDALTPYFYNWSNSETTEDLVGIASGDYNVTVTFATNCEYIASFNVGENPETQILISNIAAQYNSNYLGFATINYSGLLEGSYNITATNNNDVNYNFDFDSQNPLLSLQHLTCGLYNVTLTSPLGCETIEEFSVACVNTSSTPSCPNTENDGAASVNITVFGSDNGITGNMFWPTTGDHTPITFDEEYQTTYSNLNSGNYTFSITDDWGNLITNTVTVDELDEITITANVTAPVFAEVSPGSVTISFLPSDLTGYTVTIQSIDNPAVVYSFADQQEPIVLSLTQTGDFLVTLSSPNPSCPDITTIFNMPFFKPLETELYLTPSTCDRYSGTLTITVSNSWPPYTVNIWQDGIHVVPELVYDAAGQYSISLNNLNSMNLIWVYVVDSYGNFNEFPYIMPDYLWNTGIDIVTTDNVLSSYTDRILCIGTASDQTLNIIEVDQNLTFTNCTIYCATHHYTNVSETQWTIAGNNDLILDHCIVQSGCPDQMWQGIRAWGGCGAQNPDVQSLVEIKNSSVITDAIRAVESVHGAIIKANSSTFSNNCYDIYMHPHCSPYSLTKIDFNTFSTIGHLNNPDLYPKAHVFMDNIRNLTFRGNTFTNLNEWNGLDYVNKRGIGIDAKQSYFVVTPVSITSSFPISSTHKNNFNGLYYGVRVSGQRTYAPKIQHNQFTNNYRGVKLTGTTGARVIYNTFYTTAITQPFDAHLGYTANNTQSYDASYAAYLDRATNTWFEENKIFEGMAGAYVYNTGAAGTRFYRNNFGRDGDYVNYTPRGMDAATVVVGSNSDYEQFDEDHIGATGLQVRCNDYMANDFAISVFNGNMRVKQGENYTGVTTDKLAGNQFHSTLVNGIEFNVNVDEEPGFLYDYSDLNIGDDYKYNQHDDEDGDSEDNGAHRELWTHSDGVQGITVQGMGFETTESCPSNFGLHIFDHGTAISDISVRKSSLDELQKQYDKVVDKGDTWYMKSVAKLMNNANYADAYEILQNEGYLTDTVLIALICNEIAPSNAIAAILLENSPLPEKVVKLIEDMPLSSNIKNWLSFYSSGLNSRIELEYQIEDLQQEILDVESELLNNAVNNDSTTTVIDATLNYYYQKSNKDYVDYISIYKLNISTDNLLNAESTLLQLRTYAAQQPSEIATELITFCDVNEIYLDYISNEHGDTAILARNKEILFSAARSTSALYSATAEILYSYITDSSFYEYTPMPFEVMTPRNLEAITEEPVLFKPQIKVYPNPSDGLVFVDYNFAEQYTEGYELIYKALGIEQKANCEHGEIRVYTNDAKLLQTVPLNSLEGMITIDIRSYTPGTYLLEIADCFGNLETVKITKTY